MSPWGRSDDRVRPGADVSSAVRNLYRYRVRQRALLAGFVARHSDRAPSLRELKLPQKRLVARIAGEPAQKSVAFDVHQTAVTLGIGALEPLEGKIRLAAEGMHFGDLKGCCVGVLFLQGGERRVGLAAP